MRNGYATGFNGYVKNKPLTEMLFMNLTYTRFEIAA